MARGPGPRVGQPDEFAQQTNADMEIDSAVVPVPFWCRISLGFLLRPDMSGLRRDKPSSSWRGLISRAMPYTKVPTMSRSRHILILSAIAISIIVVSAVCWHSVQEIHYLKSFYPKEFTVEQAFYASAVELIKVLIISVPFFFIIMTGFWLLRYWKRNS